MANTRHDIPGRRPRRAGSAGRLPWVSELHLDAYLEARDALRRAHAASLKTTIARPPNSRSSAS
jgi:hypothetical protein